MVNRSEPIRGAVALTSGDTAEAKGVNAFRGLYLEAAGSVSLIMEDGTTFAADNLTAGIWHPLYYRVATTVPAGSYGGK
jgi:hypothetical protein